MTKDEAIAKAKATAEAEGWLWQGPVFAQARRRGLLFGPRFWEVRSNCASRGQNVEVVIDDASGEIAGKAFLAR